LAWFSATCLSDGFWQNKWLKKNIEIKVKRNFMRIEFETISAAYFGI